MRECACGCGRIILRRKDRGHREREYYSDACRKRAYRKRNKWKHDLERHRREAEERRLIAIEQKVYREDWQNERAWLLNRIEQLQQQQSRVQFERDLAIAQVDVWKLEIQFVREQVADKDAEIMRLTALLNAQRKREHCFL